jgi:hypothetical protein
MERIIVAIGEKDMIRAKIGINTDTHTPIVPEQSQ